MADFDEVREQYHRALESYIRGDSEPVRRLWSRRDDVTLANPLGPPVRGWDAVREIGDRAASQIREGEAFSIESISTYATTDLAYEVNHSYTRRTRPYAMAREVEDVAALLEVAGGNAALWHRHIRRAPIALTPAHAQAD